MEGIGGAAIVLFLASTLVVYLKRLEERELGERFGEAYLVYRRAVPFIVPRLPDAARALGIRHDRQPSSS